MTVQLFLHRPKDFKPLLEVSGVFCEYEDRILYLKRHGSKVEGLRWGIPAGKLEENEIPLETARRELAEEVGIATSHEALIKVATFYIKRSEVDFIFHMFYLPLQEMPLLQLALDENIESAWVNFQESAQLPLISGGREALEYFYLWKNDIKQLKKR